MRKSLSAATLALILAAGMPLSAVRAETPSLRDMPGHWAQDLVQHAAANGYVNGYPDGTFRPDAPVTRAEAVKLLTAAGQLHPIIQAGRQDFSDLLPWHWVSAQGYSHAAVDYGLMVPGTRWAPEPLPFADPIPKEAQRWVSAGRAMGLGQVIPVPNLEDAAGNAVKDAERQPVTYSVDPASPLRLRSNWNPDTYLTAYTAGPENNWQQPIVLVLPGAAKGTYGVKIEAAGYGAGEQPVVVQ